MDGLPAFGAHLQECCDQTVTEGYGSENVRNNFANYHRIHRRHRVPNTLDQIFEHFVVNIVHIDFLDLIARVPEPRPVLVNFELPRAHAAKAWVLGACCNLWVVSSDGGFFERRNIDYQSVQIVGGCSDDQQPQNWAAIGTPPKTTITPFFSFFGILPSYSSDFFWVTSVT